MPTDDPPIIVGGGGSTYIWILKTLSPGALQPVQNPQPDYPVTNQSLYNCYDVQVNLGSYKTHDGNNEGTPTEIKARRRHRTRFYQEQTKISNRVLVEKKDLTEFGK